MPRYDAINLGEYYSVKKAALAGRAVMFTALRRRQSHQTSVRPTARSKESGMGD